MKSGHANQFGGAKSGLVQVRFSFPFISRDESTILHLNLNDLDGKRACND